MAAKKIKNTKVTEPVVIEEEVVTAVSYERPQSGAFVIPKKRLLWFVLLLALALFAFWYQTNSWPIAAFVNGRPVTRFELDQELYRQGGQQVLDNIITEKLVQSELAKSKVEVSDADVTARIDEIKANLGESFDAALAAQGVTLEELESQITTQLKLEKMLSSQASVSAEEIDQATSDGQTDRETAEAFILQQKVQELISGWVQELKAKANVMIVGKQPAAEETGI